MRDDWPVAVFELLMAAIVGYVAVLAFQQGFWFLSGLCVAGACFAISLAVKIYRESA